MDKNRNANRQTVTGKNKSGRKRAETLLQRYQSVSYISPDGQEDRNIVNTVEGYALNRAATFAKNQGLLDDDVRISRPASPRTQLSRIPLDLRDETLELADFILDDVNNDEIGSAIQAAEDASQYSSKIIRKDDSAVVDASNQLIGLYTAHSQHYRKLYDIVQKFAYEGDTKADATTIGEYDVSDVSDLDPDLHPDEDGHVQMPKSDPEKIAKVKTRGAIPKKAMRAVEKGLLKYGEDYSLLTDLTAFSLAYKNLEDMQQGLATLRERLSNEGQEIVNVKNRFAQDPKHSDPLGKVKEGYSDILINVKDKESGYVWELQIHLGTLLKDKSEVHSIYNDYRSLNEWMAYVNNQARNLTEEQKATLDKVREKARAALEKGDNAMNTVYADKNTNLFAQKKALLNQIIASFPSTNQKPRQPNSVLDTVNSRSQVPRYQTAKGIAEAYEARVQQYREVNNGKQNDALPNKTFDEQIQKLNNLIEKLDSKVGAWKQTRELKKVVAVEAAKIPATRDEIAAMSPGDQAKSYAFFRENSGREYTGKSKDRLMSADQLRAFEKVTSVYLAQQLSTMTESLRDELYNSYESNLANLPPRQMPMYRMLQQDQFLRRLQPNEKAQLKPIYEAEWNDLPLGQRNMYELLRAEL